MRIQILAHYHGPHIPTSKHSPLLVNINVPSLFALFVSESLSSHPINSKTYSLYSLYSKLLITIKRVFLSASVYLQCFTKYCSNCNVLCSSLYCTPLQFSSQLCTELHCTKLHCSTLSYTTLQHTAVHYSTIHCSTLPYTALQHTTVHYSTMHCSTLLCNAL